MLPYNAKVSGAVYLILRNNNKGFFCKGTILQRLKQRPLR